MNFSLYVLFVLTSITTVATPDPGVLMTLMKSMHVGFRGAIFTIFGTASGTVIMAILSATGLSVVLHASPAAYTVIRAIGGCYMIYLGVRNWRVKALSLSSALKKREKALGEEDASSEATIRPVPFFLEGIFLQLTNPMLLMFFVSLFPQFIDPNYSYALQFGTMSFTYFALVVVIHSGYSLIVTRFRTLFKSERAVKLVYRSGGSLFIMLGVFVLYNLVKSYL